MRFRIKYADQVVGVFILLALTLVVAALFFVALNQRWLVHNTSFVSRFTSANNISVGTVINLRGFEIGKISKLTLNEDNLVDIEFYVYPEYLDKVTAYSVLELSTSPIGLGTSLIFHKGKSTQRLAEYDEVPALDSVKGQALEQAGLVDMPKKDDTISRLLAQVNSVLENLDLVVLQLADLDAGGRPGPVRDLLANANGTLASLGPVVGKAGATLDTVNQSLPGVMAQIDAILLQVNAAMADLKLMTASLSDTNGLVPRLMGDPQFMAKIDGILAGLNQSVVQLQSMMAGLNAEVPKLSSTITEVRGAIANAQDVMEGLKNNPLLKGGITEKPEQQALFQSLRKEEF